MPQYYPYARDKSRSKDYHPFLAIALGEQLLPIILPTAYYECALRDLKETLDGAYIDGKHVTLSSSSQRTALFFRDAYYKYKCSNIKFRHGVVSHLEMEGNGECTCSGNGVLIATKLEELFFDLSGHDIFSTRVVPEHVPSADTPPCATCQTAFSRVEARLRWDLWSLLPKFCGRGTWEELQRQHDARDDAHDP